MFTLLVQLQDLKWVAPTLFMLGSAPNFYIVWCAWRALTVLLPNRVYATGDQFMYSMYQRMLLFFFENYSGVEVILYGDVDEMKKKAENTILICNHQSTVDWLIADMLAVRQGTIGNIRYILKDGLKYFPMYGFYFWQHSCIYVKRSGKFKQERACTELDQIVSTKLPFWMVVFPEGTRLNEKTLAKSHEFAQEKGLPCYSDVLVPRQKALQLCIQHLRQTTDAFYDVTIAYSDTTDPVTKKRLDAPGLAEFLQCQSKKLHILLHRIDMSDVPQEEEAVKGWLLKRYAEKNKLLSDFYSPDSPHQGTLGEGGHHDKLSLRQTLPSFLFFAALMVPLLATQTGRSYYWKSALIGTCISWSWMFIRA